MYTSAAETLLLHEVDSRLRHAIPSTVPKTGADDDQELLQDGLVIALGMLRAAGNSEKKSGFAGECRVLHAQTPPRRSPQYRLSQE